MDFAALLLRVAERDSQAWAALLRVVARAARRAAGRHRMNDADTRDLVQAVALALFERLPVREPARLPGWLATTIARQARRIISRRGRELPLPSDRWVPAWNSPESAALAAERDHALWQAAARLSSARARRLVWLLAHRPDLTQEQLAAELDVSPGTVGPLRRRSLDTLRTHLLAAGFDASDLD